jgi:hypothetical protein
VRGQDRVGWVPCPLTFLFSHSSHIHRSHSPALIAVRPSFSTIRCKTLNIFIKACYALPCISKPIPARLPRASKGSFTRSVRLPLSNLSLQFLSSLPPMALSPLTATLMHLPASVADKRLTAWLNPLDATLTKNTGAGIPRCSIPFPLSFNFRLSTSSQGPSICLPPQEC